MSRAPRRTPRETTRVESYTNDQYVNAQMEAPPSVKREPRKPKKLEPLRRNRAPLREAPITGMGSAEINAFLSQHIHEQSHSLYKLSQLLYQGMTLDRMPEGAHKPLLFRAMLCGTSGCGKTETIEWIKYLLGMQPGYAYERQCVELDASTLVDETQMSSIIGAGAGLVGYGDGNSLPERLNRALYDFGNDEWVKLLQLENGSAARRQAEALYFQRRALMTQEAHDDITPRYLLFFVDELDKACAQFYTLLNGLVETGHYRTNSGIEFRLPPRCRMFILYTSNFGADEISQMKLRDYEAGCKYVTDDMLAHGLGPYTIGRLNRCICIYYPLKPELLRRILMDKLDRYIAESPMAREYGRDTIHYTPEVKDFLVNGVLCRASPDLGVRDGLTKLFANLDTLFQEGLESLHRMAIEPRFTRPSPEHPITLSMHSLDAQQIMLHHAVAPLLQQVLSEKKNEDILALCRERHEGVDAVTMTRKQILLGSLLLNINIQCDPQELAEVADEMDRLRDAGEEWKAEVDQTRDTLGQIIEAIDARDLDTARTLATDRLDAIAMRVEEVPRIAKRKKKASRGADEQTKRIKHADDARASPRVEDVTSEPEQEEEEEAMEVEKQSQQSTTPARVSRGNGKPHKQFAGFQFSHMDGNRHAKYQCVACAHVCDARYTTTHRCC